MGWSWLDRQDSLRPEHLELGGVGFAGLDNQGDAVIPRQGKEGPEKKPWPRDWERSGEAGFFSANGDVRFVPPPPTCSLLFPSPFSTGPDGHRPTDLTLGGSFWWRNFGKNGQSFCKGEGAASGVLGKANPICGQETRMQLVTHSPAA